MKKATFCAYWNEKLKSILDECETIDYFDEIEIYRRARSRTRGKTMDYNSFCDLVDKIAEDLYK